MSKNITDDFGTPLALGDIVEDYNEPERSPWKFHYVEDMGDGPQIRDFNAHNVGMTGIGSAKRVGPWNDPVVVERLIKAGVHKSAEDIEADVWELMKDRESAK